MFSRCMSGRRADSSRFPRHARSRLRLEALEGREVPATFVVNTTLDVVNPDDGKQSLREAITRANTTTGADVVVLPAGVFKMTIGGAGDDFNSSGDFDVRDSVTIRGAGAGATIVDGQHLDRVFDVIGTFPGSVDVVVHGLMVRNGSASGDGGGIRVANADLVVRDAAVTANRATGSGGGISNTYPPEVGNVTLIRSIVGRNVSSLGNGGGIAVSAPGELIVRDSTIRRNTAPYGGGLFAATANLTNSAVNGNYAIVSGGGIDAGTATLTGSRVMGNTAGIAGGGILASSADLTNCTVGGNSAASSGGGIRTFIDAKLKGSSVSGNTAGTGGGISTETVTLINCTVSENFAGMGDGGGILATTATLTNSTVGGNVAANGGGIFASSAAVLTGSTVSDNKAMAVGGGISAYTAMLTNCTVSGNTAAERAGGLIAVGATLLNCTVVENVAAFNGGVYHTTNFVPFIVKNSIIAMNVASSGDPDVSGFYTSQGHNLIGIYGFGFDNGVNGDMVGTSANPMDPKLGPLQKNGGPTMTHAPLAGRPAVDAGDAAIDYITNLPVTTDQRGQARKKDGNGNGVAIVDIGAVER